MAGRHSMSRQAVFVLLNILILGIVRSNIFDCVARFVGNAAIFGGRLGKNPRSRIPFDYGRFGVVQGSQGADSRGSRPAFIASAEMHQFEG